MNPIKMTDGTLLVCDIGGSHASAAQFDLARSKLDTLQHVEPAAGLTAKEYIEQLCCAAAAPAFAGAAFSIPNPFDYEHGISFMTHKLPQLYQANLRELVSQQLSCDKNQVVFLNDAAAFLLGEIYAGAAHGNKRTIGITLGTGIGSAFAIGKQIVYGVDGVPASGEIWNMPYEGGIIEDLVSTRTLMQLYSDCSGETLPVREIALRAADEPTAADAFKQYGKNLAAALRPYLQNFHPEAIVIGGGIARALPLFIDALESALQAPDVKITPASLGDSAPLMGAAFAWINKS